MDARGRGGWRGARIASVPDANGDVLRGIPVRVPAETVSARRGWPEVGVSELDHLWRLHLLDEEANAVRATLEKYPQEKKDAEHRLEEGRTALARNKAVSVEAQKQRRELERQVEAVSAEERKFQAQLPQVKKNEEYQALLHEIEGAKARRSEIETRVLVRLEEEERLESERPALEKALSQAESEVQAHLARIAVQEKQERDALGALDARRDMQREGLTPATRSRYDRIHGLRQGRAVVAVDKNACGGCYRALPPQLLQEAKKRDRLLICEGCGRMLVYPPDAL
jgi:uncharacterized protein